LFAVACFFPGRAKGLSAPRYKVDSYLAVNRVHQHYFKSDRQCTYVISWRIHVTIVTAETIGIDVALSIIKVFNVAMEMQKWVPFALLESYKILHSVFNEY